MSTLWNEFDVRQKELKDLKSVTELVGWDQETMMPPSAASNRAHQLSTMQALIHERLTAPRMGELVASLSESQSLTPNQRASVLNLGRERDRAIKIPVALVKSLAEAQSEGVESWRVARREKRFSHFAPKLRRLVALRREMADLWGHSGERYDALLAGYEPGMTVARLEPLFGRLLAGLVELVTALSKAPRQLERSWIASRTFPVDAQWALTLEALKTMGFDMASGRQDRSSHPFSCGVHTSDVRLTTRLDERDPFSALFSSLHEGGHGLYEQGFGPDLDRTFASGAPSFGLHESQSRLWENLIGRSPAFWRHFAPKMRSAFPGQLEGISDQQLMEAVNVVEPSLIRVEADEVTYNLHILLRFELELALMRGEMQVEELPAAWNVRMEQYLGVRPPDDGVGVLQDIHWSLGDLGYFPTYTLGNLYSVALHEAAGRALPELESQVARGELLPLREWLRAHIHGPASTQEAEALVKQVTGQPLSEGPFLGYLWRKYGSLVGIPPRA